MHPFRLAHLARTQLPQLDVPLNPGCDRAGEGGRKSSSIPTGPLPHGIAGGDEVVIGNPRGEVRIPCPAL